ncbi:MAG: flagellar protein FlaG [Anaerolineae bacterium]
MDVIERVNFETLPDRHQVVDAAEFVWRSYIIAAQEQKPLVPIDEAEVGPGLSNSDTERQMQRSRAHAEFEVVKKTGEVIIKIIDEASGEIVRTVPPDELAKYLRSGDNWTRRWHIYV